jgi:hypothetical protein
MAPRKTAEAAAAQDEDALKPTANADAPLFRVNQKSFIGHAVVEAGAEINFTPKPGGEIGENLSPINDAAQALVDAQKGDHPDKGAPVADEADDLT